MDRGPILWPEVKERPKMRRCLWCNRRVKNDVVSQWKHVEKYHYLEWLAQGCLRLFQYFLFPEEFDVDKRV